MKHFGNTATQWKSRLLDTLREVIKSGRWDKVTAKSAGSKTIANTNWRRIPNAAQFSIHLDKYSDIWQKILGVSRRTSTQMEIVKGRNSGMNRYIDHQISRLRKLKQNPDAYFRIAFWLMLHSKSFRVSAIHHVFPLWYRNKKLSQIKSINTKTTRIIKTQWKEMMSEFTNSDYPTPRLAIQLKRVYIEKEKKGEWRPLGVPQPQWRLFLHMFANFLYIFLEHHFLDSQHGFIPGRGTMSAWSQFFKKKLYNYKYIYEIDLKKCFDSLTHIFIEVRLAEGKVPAPVRHLVNRLNKSSPKFPDEEKLDESRHKSNLVKMYMNQYEPHTIKLVNSTRTTDQAKTEFLFQRLLLYRPELHSKVYPNLYAKYYPRTNPVVPDAKDMITPSGHWVGLLKRDFTEEGTPQGSAMGPLLAAFCLIPFFNQLTSLSYADDGLFFSNQPITLEIMALTGIKLNEEKSGYVKYDGKWLKPFKFLGLQFDGTTLAARTRKGSKLILSHTIAGCLSAIDNLENLSDQWVSPGNRLHIIENKLNHIQESWRNLMGSKYMGYIMSRLYNNSWDLGHIEQDFTLRFSKDSWTDIYPSKMLIRWEEIKINNISTFASESLAHILAGKSGIVDFDKYIIFKKLKSAQRISDKLAKAWETKDRKKFFAIKNYYKKRSLGV